MESSAVTSIQIKDFTSEINHLHRLLVSVTEIITLYISDLYKHISQELNL
jgi:hypothetical protein